MQNEVSKETHDKILVVDDCSANLQLLTNVLVKQGYSVYPASDGELALEFVQKTFPDLVILDIRMPEMDGFEVCRRLKADERTRAIPIIFISILENEEDKVKGFQAGAVDYITKPFQTEEVLARVKTHLRLRELTVQLEQKVQERTEELITTNQQLQQELAKRIKAQAKLASEQSLLRSLIDSVSDLIFIKDLNGIYRGCNKASEAFIGLPESEQIGKTDFDFFDPEKAKGIQKDDTIVFETGVPLRVEEWVTSRDGNRLLMDTVKTPYYNPEGKILGLVGISRDITERKKAEEVLRETAKRLGEAQRLAYIGSWELDIVNDSFTGSEEIFRIFEIDPDKFGATHEAFLNAVHPDDRETVSLAYRNSLKTKTPFTIDHRLFLPDGRIKYVRVQCRSFYDGDIAIRSIGTAQDITERKQVEELNKARLHLMQFAVTHSMDHFLEETLNEAEKITQSNIGFYSFVDDDQLSLSLQNWSTGTKAEFCSSKVENLHYKVAEAGVWAECITQRKPAIHNDYASLPHRKGLPEGHAELVRELVVPVMRNGKIKAVVAVGNKQKEYNESDVETLTLLADFSWEIAERKRTEEELARYHNQLEDLVQERTVELEASNKELEAFAYSISHDLRVPLRHIHGFLELLKKNIKAELDEQGRRYMEIISSTTIKMASMIDNLLSFSRMGRKEMSFQPVKLDALIDDVIRELDPDTDRREISWKIGELNVVKGDPSMLKIVLTNLISNALKFTRLRLKAQIEIESLPGQNSETVICVRDNGVGFDMKYADKLFGVFQRLHRADEFEGTGIGLANVRRIIARHGGRTWAEGKVDQGASFYFSLPF